MFEGLLRQLLGGFLGRYVKNIQKDQLKFDLWKEKLKLEKVELIPEAFDYLQLPFALKQGCIGSLSIKIIWKKFGQKPIKIKIKDVILCFGERDDHEWSLEAVERREFAGKKAKLATAELAKLSQRVCANQAGQIFISFISAKILDGVQLSIRNVNVEYIDEQHDLAKFRVGLRLSSLELKQNSVGSYGVEVLGLALYCNTHDELVVAGVVDTQPYEYILDPFDATASLVVNKSGKLDDGVPQYSINADTTSLVMLLNEIQLRQLLVLSDYLGMSALKEKYGRYRPWHNLLMKKQEGWQKMWWHYAQVSVLSDVRRKLWKTSWSSLGQRLSCRHKYVQLYRKKLAFLFQELPVNDDILKELEQMEKEADVDDILTYRFIAESKPLEFLSNIKSSGTTHTFDTAQEKLQIDEKSSNKQKGWLNWLSLGMLGAGGTDDSGQFSGVVPDEIVKDIFEATDFHLGASFNGDTCTARNKIYFSSIKLNVHQVICKLASKVRKLEILHAIADEVSIEYKLWEDASVILASINSLEIIDPCSKGVLFARKKDIMEDGGYLVNLGQPLVSAKVKSLSMNSESELSVEVRFQPFEVLYDPVISEHLLDAYHVWSSFQFQSERVLSSFNGFEDLTVRLLLKAEHIFLNRKRVIVDVSFSKVSAKIPWTNEDSECFVMVLDLGGGLLKSTPDKVSLPFTKENESKCFLKKTLSSALAEKLSAALHFDDLYDYYKIDFTDISVKIVMPSCFQAISIFERFNAFVLFGSSVLKDESILKQLEVQCYVSSLVVHFSASICDAFVKLVLYLGNAQASRPKQLDASNLLKYSLLLDLDHMYLDIDLEDSSEESLLIVASSEMLRIRCVQQDYLDCCFSMKAIEINSSAMRGESTGQVLCSYRKPSAANASKNVEHRIPHESCNGDWSSSQGCLFLHYQSNRCASTVSFSHMDFHFYPVIMGLLHVFFAKLIVLGGASSSSVHSSLESDGEEPRLLSRSEPQKYGFSNYCENDSSLLPRITFDSFPFLTIRKWDPSSDLCKSCILGPLEWRSFHVNNGKPVTGQECSARKRSGKSFYSPGRHVSADYSNVNDGYSLSLTITDCKAHFHDSSCIVGSLCIPSASSLIISEGTNSLDIMVSVEGLLASSSWSIPKVHDIIWGPALPDVSPILNFRVRRTKNGASVPTLDICIGVQRVRCILSLDYLAILIGYFALPEWKMNHTEDIGNDSDNQSINIEYKFEILDSSVIFPLNGEGCYALQLGLQQLCCGLVLNGRPENALAGIPEESVILTDQVGDRVDRINLFGYGVSISLLLLNANGQLPLNLNQGTGVGIFPLIAELNTEMWIRIPLVMDCSGGSPCLPSLIMVRSDSCQLVVEDKYFRCGLEAAINICNELLAVDGHSKYFTSNVLKFRELKDNVIGIPDNNSSEGITKVKFHANSLSVKLFRSDKEESRPSWLVAVVEMKPNFAVDLKNDTVISLDVSVCCLVLHSMHGSTTQVLCISQGEASPCLDIHFCKRHNGPDELLLAISYINIWLHLSDWSEFIVLLSSYTSSTLSLVTSSEVTDMNYLPLKEGEPEQKLKSSSSEGCAGLVIKSEIIAVEFHFPLVSKETCDESGGDGASLDERKHSRALGNGCKNVALTLHSKCSEIVVSDSLVKLNCNVDKIEGRLEENASRHLNSFPFFQVFQVNMAGNICKELAHLSLDIFVETLNLSLSHQTLNFWINVKFEIPQGTATSQASKCNVILKFHLKKASFSLSDGRWTYDGPLLEALLKNLVSSVTRKANSMETLTEGDLVVYYNNMNKVTWEPFIEPWFFQLKLDREYEQNALMNTTVVTDINLTSGAPLNMNITEPLIKAIVRGSEMVKDSFYQNEPRNLSNSGGTSNSDASDNMHSGRYAPYTLKNDTSMLLSYWVWYGYTNTENHETASKNKGNIVLPGSSVPIYVDQSPKEQVLRHRPAHSSDKLNEKKSNGAPHHMISIQLDGTSGPSAPLSMDLVGLSYFEVDFSRKTDIVEADNSGLPTYERKIEEVSSTDLSGSFVVPVVFDVSVHHYSKLLRLYSTVVLFNGTSVPLELRFDIPFGVSSVVLDPIYPGKELPLPVHLAESGRMRWRPLGTNYLWSEAYTLSNILSQENRLGFLRSFICYPSHPSTGPFRCCISIQDVALLPSCGKEKLSSYQFQEDMTESGYSDKPKRRCIRQVRLTTPLLVKSYLPKKLTVTIESGGMTQPLFLSEIGTASVFHIDSSHDVGIVVHMSGYKHIELKFPRAEIFCGNAKLIGYKFSQMEMLTFYPDELGVPLCVSMEKVVDALCGSRELHISVSFWVYNCTGIPLAISNYSNENAGCDFVIPSCYNSVSSEKLAGAKDGLALVYSAQEPLKKSSESIACLVSSSNNCMNSPSEVSLPSRSMTKKGIMPSKKMRSGCDLSECLDLERADVFMYSPPCSSPRSDLMVRLSIYLPRCAHQSNLKSMWSTPFFLTSPTGSTSVSVPQPSMNGSFLLSVTSSPIGGALMSRTRSVTFQPRYVISNACHRALRFKQKGTDSFYRLEISRHAHLHWPDTTRDLLVSVRFNEPGWEWSGSFLPDQLGDALVKMRNYISAALNMVRVEVQNANILIGDEKIGGSPSGESGTYLILLSDDETGFMPYRIDNFSMERLRVYQQKCETFETIVHPYTSCSYAWDEPCYPHRLVIEVPGERIIGLYDLDDVRECTPVYLPRTSEKPQRRLLLSIHAEGAIKVLSIADSTHHVLKDIRTAGFPGFRDKKKLDLKEKSDDFTERITVHLSFTGISLISSSPQELIFACAKDARIEFLQSISQQKFTLQIFSLQIDNQLQNTLYPVILSFNHEHRGSLSIQLKEKQDLLISKPENAGQTVPDNACEPIFCFSAAKWRKEDNSLVSFEYINLRLAPLWVEVEEQVLLHLFDFVRVVILNFPSSTTENLPLDYVTSFSGQLENKRGGDLLPSIIPLGAPWQQIFLLARQKKKMYFEVFDIAPIRLTVSFSSTPWMLRNTAHVKAESLIPIGGSAVQRGLMALVDIEGAPVYLRQLTIAHHMASWDSIREIIVRHYTRQLLHEVYKVFGSAGLIGNPMGFARNVGLGLRDFLFVPAKGVLESPTGLITGMAEGTRSLFNNTVYAISNAATQFSKAAHKGIMAFTFDEQAVANQQSSFDSNSRGVINEVLEGLTGLLQSPIRGAEKHGLPGVLSGIALGTAGLVARPVASILEVAGKTAQSIRNRSSPHQPTRLRVRLPRPLARELPLAPYSWEEAIGISMLLLAENSKFTDEMFVMCKASKQPGRFVTVTERLFIVFNSPCLVGFGSAEFPGIGDPQWAIEVEMALESVVHIDRDEDVVNVVCRSPETISRQLQVRRSSMRTTTSGSSSSSPIFQTSVELTSKEEAESVVQALQHSIDRGKGQRWGAHVLHRIHLK